MITKMNGNETGLSFISEDTDKQGKTIVIR